MTGRACGMRQTTVATAHECVPAVLVAANRVSVSSLCAMVLTPTACFSCMASPTRMEPTILGVPPSSRDSTSRR